MGNANKPRPRTFRYRARQNELATLEQMSDDDKIKLIKDARVYRNFVRDLRQYNDLREAAALKDVRTDLVQKPSLPGDNGDQFRIFLSWLCADNYSDGVDAERAINDAFRALDRRIQRASKAADAWARLN